MDRALPPRHRRMAGRAGRPFFNVNTPAEAAEADRMAALHPEI